MTIEHEDDRVDAASRALEEAVADHVDRLTAGEPVDPERVLTEHPGIGHEILECLESFVDLEAQSDALRTSWRLGDYTLGRRIGRGGMGVVYEARQESLDRSVAMSTPAEVTTPGT